MKGLTFRNSVTYKIARFRPPKLSHVRIRQGYPLQLLKADTGKEEVSLTAHEAIATDSAGNIFVADTG